MSKLYFEAGLQEVEKRSYYFARDYFSQSGEPDAEKYHTYCDMMCHLNLAGGDLSLAYELTISIKDFLDVQELLQTNEYLKLLGELDGTKWRTIVDDDILEIENGVFVVTNYFGEKEYHIYSGLIIDNEELKMGNDGTYRWGWKNQRWFDYKLSVQEIDRLYY